jgi:hypothetical protein
MVLERSGTVHGPLPDRFLDAVRHGSVLTVAIAQGVLAERYKVDCELASWLLAHRAQCEGPGRRGCAVVAGRWMPLLTRI